jgi:hypothetical protein
MPLAELTSFLGANTRIEPRFLQPGIGVSSVNQKPSESGDFRPWRNPLTIAGPVVPAGRQTLYRMGRDTPSPTNFWLSWTTVVHAIRGFETNDTTERTYFTGSGTPKWTDNILALASAPYPAGTRELSVPQPTVAPSAVLNVDGPSGEPRRLYYCFTWVNDIGWESAPSPPVLAPLAMPGAIIDLITSESVPAGNYGVTKIRWYRTQTVNALGDAEFFFLREYAIGLTGMQDDGRELGTDVLPTAANTLRLPLPSTAKGLTYCWNQFAAALVGKTVRFCEPTLMYAWPLGNEYEVGDTPIALAAFAQRLLVLTSHGGELFTGTDPEGMDQKPVAIAPIVSARSLVVGESFCIWAAADGLWYWGLDGYRNLVGECLKPEQWAALVPSTIHGHYFEIGNRPVYIGFYNDGALKGFVVDPTNPGGIYFLSAGYTAAYWDKLQRKLFVLDGATLKQFDGDASFMTASFKGKINRQIAETEAEWLELLAHGMTTVKLWVDGANVYDHEIAKGEHRTHDGTEGREFQLEIASNMPVQGIVVE